MSRDGRLGCQYAECLSSISTVVTEGQQQEVWSVLRQLNDGDLHSNCKRKTWLTVHAPATSFWTRRRATVALSVQNIKHLLRNEMMRSAIHWGGPGTALVAT
eukprot:1342208-Amorphochlora_amoeboformis.AAC.1